jgi:hypothetical protein
MVSSKSEKKRDAIKLRDRIMKREMAGTLPGLGAAKLRAAR